MISAFVNRRPWPAGLVAFFMGPMVSMFYLGKGRLGLAYLFIPWLLFAALPVAAHLGLVPVSFETAFALLILLVLITGAVHCFRIAKRQQLAVPQRWFSRWYAVLLIWGLPIAFASAVRAFLWEPFDLPSASMEPSFRVGDHFFVSKFAYDSRDPARGETVVFLLPADGTMAYFKRLIGLPGDKLQMIEGRLYLNGVSVAREEVDNPVAGDRGKVYREHLTFERSYLIREFGYNHPYDNTGVYEVPEGHYFFLGDNRDNSLDSRANIGFVPRENLIDPAVLIYWNSEAQKLRFERLD